MANVCKVAMRWRWEALDPVEPALDTVLPDIVTTFHVQKLDSLPAPTLAERAAIAAAVLAAWQTDGDYSDKLNELYRPEMNLDAVEVRNVEPALTDADTFVNLLPAGTAGGGIALPPQCAHLIGLRTTVDSRRYRGRIFWPAVQNREWAIAMGSGRVAAEIRDDVARACQELARRIRGLTVDQATWALCVYSRVAGDSLAVTHFDVPDVIATQRERALTPTGRWLFALNADPDQGGGDPVP